jgi:hypothetical protein
MPEDDASDDGRTGGPQKLADAWVFVSHSHQDLDAVRRVRDEFERMHANPLLFFLMCLNENEEVDSLIKREITARNFFLLCDSPTARKSAWVRKERAFVQSLKGRIIHKIDLDWPWDQQQRVIHETLRSATTFLNYASNDLDRIRPYIDLLVKNDFAVFSFDFGRFDASKSFADLTDAAIDEAIQGHFITFLSNAWLQSRFGHKELSRFLERTRDMKDRPEPVLAAVDPIPFITPSCPENF